jgi:hypothetical protein
MKERELYISLGESLDSVINTLIEANNRGERVFVNFNGHKLHSQGITVDSAYMEMHGCTKAEWLRRQQERREEYNKSKKEELFEPVNTSELIEKGKKVIFPERYEAWEQFVKDNVDDIYGGQDIATAVKIMEALEAGASMDQVKLMFEKQRYSGSSSGRVRRIVFAFSSQGPEFWEVTALTKLTSKDRKILEAKKKENAILRANQTNNENEKRI